MTPEQEVSNRSILRVQQLSDELRDQLNQMRLFDGFLGPAKDEFLGPVKEVFLAARDHRFEQTPDAQAVRWYNFRLTASYDFCENDRKWIADKDNKKKFKPLFELAKSFEPNTAASYEKFEAGVGLWGADGSTEDPARKAFDQFTIALAVIPYRGILPALFEKQFNPDPAERPEKRPSSFLFHSSEAEHFRFAEFNEFQANDWGKPFQMEPLKFSLAQQLQLKAAELSSSRQDKLAMAGIKVNTNQGSVISEGGIKAILEFTRGQPNPFGRHLSERIKDVSPPASNNSVEMNPEEDLRGLVVPAYDIWCQDSPTVAEFRGGILGWIVIILEREAEKFIDRAMRIDSAMAALSWSHFTDLVRSYVRRVREANIRDLLEDYAEPGGSRESPREYFLSHLHQVIGWRKSTEGNCALEIPMNDERDDIKAWVSPLLPDTRWQRCEESGKGTTFPPGTRRLCRLFLDELELVRAKHQEGQQSGQSKNFHDTSKDLNVLEDQLQRYTKDVKGVREAVEREAQELLALDTLPPTARDSVQRVADQVKRLGDPNLDYMLRLQFLMSHLRVKTEGRLYEAPAWCWQLLESGTKRDIYLILRALVWRPFGWAWYDKELKTLPESALTDDSLTWTRIFLFDEDREEIKPRNLSDEVRRGISAVFRKLFFQLRISKPDYEACFPPPDVNADADWDDSLLWKMDGEDRKHHRIWLPSVKLLPLFVFALRTAFEHAFLRNFLHVIDADTLERLKGQKPRGIRIRESKGLNPGGAGIHHRIHIAFPALGIEPEFSTPLKTEREAADLPYGNWNNHMNHYRHVSRPWHWFAERVAGSLERDLPDQWHYEITLEARE